MKYILFSWLLIPTLASSQVIHTRVYSKGETFQYRLTTLNFKNGKPDTRTISISQHQVVEDSGHLMEQVSWTSKIFYSKKDTLYLDSIARKVQPFKISIAEKDRLKIPPLVVADMTGEITDLITFYVAVSPNLHVQQLTLKDFSFKDSVLHGNFADGIQILSGEDRIQVSQRLIRQDKNLSMIETSFTPPDQLSITPLLDTIGRQTFDHPNNFQMVRKATGNKVNLLWGVEEFTITTTLENSTGKILSAVMGNTLKLRMRYNATSDLKEYDGEIPVTIKRTLNLELMK